MLSVLLVIAAVFAACLVLGFFGMPLFVWAIAGAGFLYWLGLWPIGVGIFAVLALCFILPPIRRLIAGGPIMRRFKAWGIFPPISKTERTALEAGTVWLDAELFSGRPNFKRALAEPYPGVDPEVQAFLDGPCRKVCEMTDDWDAHRRGDLSPEVWAYLKKERFFGLIVPKEYGGLGFNASGLAAVVQYMSSRSYPLSVTVMIPSSLGPAELLTHHGTDEQKKELLPKLATGEHMPCFALTEETAGSDAGSMTSKGEVFRDDNGEIKIRLNFEKRYISLATVSTLLGLAFKLRDPDELLGRGKSLGITCALIPSDADGITLGRRHDPLGVPFHNCPVDGENVIVDVDTIIGGVDGAGRGWQMLMECLAAGRGVTLPAGSVASAKMAARWAAGYTMLRRQFGIPVGTFEGIGERLARIAGFTYMMDAASIFTCAAVDAGGKPAVVTALLKYNHTELSRLLINDAMDIIGGWGVSRGPRNLFANVYSGLPIPITVEGSNILTRSMIVFGQGAIRCHPWAYEQMRAVNEDDVAGFDRAFFGHIGHMIRNTCRSFLLSISRGWFAPSPVRGPLARYWRKLSWSSASFALLADVEMLTFGGSLKRKETLTGRMSDILSWMFLALATLRRFEAEGRRLEDVPLAQYSLDEAMHRIQKGFDDVYANFDAPILGWFFRGPIAAWSRLNPVGRRASDRVARRAADVLRKIGEQRDRLTSGLFVPTAETESVARIEKALLLAAEADPVERKIRDAMRTKELPKGRPMNRLDEAVEKGIISAEEADVMRRAAEAQADVIEVDSFDVDGFADATPTPGFDSAKQ